MIEEYQGDVLDVGLTNVEIVKTVVYGDFKYQKKKATSSLDCVV
jgi:hypothetical protein